MGHYFTFGFDSLQSGFKNTTRNILSPQSYRLKWMNLWQSLMRRKNRYMECFDFFFKVALQQ